MAKIKTTFPLSFFDEEDRVLRVSKDTKRRWAIILDLYAEFKRVCDKHGIKFFAISGTLIGAARHGGFIPWDDDMDVVMMRSEYKKLEAVAAEEFKYPYFFQTNHTDPESIRGHAQLRNSSTTAILNSEMLDGKAAYLFNQGMFFDIFPLDHIPDETEERTCFLLQLQRMKKCIFDIRLNRLMARNWRRFYKTLGGIKRILQGSVELLWRKLIGRDSLSVAYSRLEAEAMRYNESNTVYCAPVAVRPMLQRHEIFKVTDFAESDELPFENMRVPCPKNYADVLTRAFGDWHKHVVDGNSHGDMLIDTERPYTYYLERDCGRQP